jgi:hypothetical protein
MTDAEFHRLTAELFPAPDRDAGARTHTAHREREHTLTALWADAETQAGIRTSAAQGPRLATRHRLLVRPGDHLTDPNG